MRPEWVSQRILRSPKPKHSKEILLSFAVPTELVDIPSKGKFYPEEHPLHNVETVEMRFMTAKEEDILTSQSLIRKGVVVDRLLQSLIVDKRINLDQLLIGDKNALVVGRSN